MILVKDLCKNFSEGKDATSKVLKSINLKIAEGECLVLKGVSGSGKSTLLSILATMMKPTSGVVEVEGKNIAIMSDYHASIYRKKHIGFVPQSFHLFEQLSVQDNLLASLVLEDYSSDEIATKIENALKSSSIAHKAKQRVSTLSGGEKQRCVIARALVNEPSIILCDEPTANLDRVNSLKFIEIMRQLKMQGKTVIIATHDPLFDSLDFVDNVIRLSEGKIE